MGGGASSETSSMKEGNTAVAGDPFRSIGPQEMQRQKQEFLLHQRLHKDRQQARTSHGNPSLSSSTSSTSHSAQISEAMFDHILEMIPFYESATARAIGETLNGYFQGGADINQQNWKGMSILLVATENQKPNLVEWALKNGADVNTRNVKGQTPLHLACGGPSHNANGS